MIRMTFYRKKIVSLLLFGILVFGVCGIFKYNSLKKNNDGKLEDAQIIFSKETGFYENEFELELSTPKGTIYYTLDGTKSDKNSIEYEKPILIRDASDNENIYSIRTDVSTGFWKEEIEKRSSGYPGYQIPEFKIDKSTIVRAVVYDELGRSSEVYSKSYFVGFSSKTGYENMKVLSIITEPENLFDYEKGIYVTGKTYDDYVKQYRESGIWEWREEFWGFWLANYRNAGIKWERKAEYHFFDENKNLVHEQRGGLRVHGVISRSYNPKSLNL